MPRARASRHGHWPLVLGVGSGGDVVAAVNKFRLFRSKGASRDPAEKDVDAVTEGAMLHAMMPRREESSSTHGAAVGGAKLYRMTTAPW